jgi:serine/threonine protein kinase/Flp pilus assembly protein TadD
LPGSSDDDRTHSYIALTSGTYTGHYRIVEKIGSGGMGEVYLAEDTQLDRKVALKFLPPHLFQYEDCRKRFRREAQAAAKLSHPNIITIHEVGDYQGRPFIAMEHVEGRSLRDITAEEFDIDRIIGIAVQLCDALQSAHAAGITHRDIKPSNIIIDSAGRPRLLDFGLATVRGGEHLTKTGSTLGTVGYMSPEQIDGKATDARSDLFSLGVVLYELIANKSPFRCDDEAATFKAIIQDEPEPLARYKSNVPDDLQRIITKLLEKDPSLRYQSAAGVIPDLKKLSPSRTSELVVEQKRDWWNRYVMPTAVVILLAIVVFWYFGDWGQDKDSAASDGKIMLAVLPFENLGDPQDAYFSEGITEEITTHLGKIAGMSVISRKSIQGSHSAASDVLRVGRELGVDYVLEGSVRWDKTTSPELVRVSVRLTRVEDNTHTWSENYERSLKQVFEIQKGVASEIGSILNRQLLQPPHEDTKITENDEAYRAYLRGLSYLDDPDANAGLAVDAFRKAISYDSNFALAYAELSRAIIGVYQDEIDTTDLLTQARQYAERALLLDSNLTEGHLALVYYYTDGLLEHKHAMEVLKELKTFVEPRGNTLRAEAAVLGNLGRFEDALECIKGALALNPENARIANGVAGALLLLGRYSEAIYYCDRSIALAPTQATAYLYKANAYHQLGDLEQASEALSGAPHRHTRVHWNQLLYERNFGAYLEEMSFIKNVLDNDVQRGWFAMLTGEALDYLDRPIQAELQYDSAQRFFISVANWKDNETIRGALGRVLARLGRHKEAEREALTAVEMCPVSKSAVDGPTHLVSLASVYVTTGEYDKAINILEHILAVSSELSAPVLRMDPRYDPLRDHPRFQALIEKYEKKHGT